MSFLRQRKINTGKRILKKDVELKVLGKSQGSSKLLGLQLFRTFRHVFDFLLDREEDATRGVRVFPRNTIFIIMLFTFWSRRNIMGSRENLWMMHPDEIYQSVEVAHSEVYGYGFRPYEFMPPLDGKNESDRSVADSQRNNLGMYSMRSWMLPRVYMTLFHLREYFQWTESPYNLARNFHAIVASVLPAVIYKLSRKLHGGSRDVACVAATNVAFCKPLLLLQTRTFAQSLLATPIWLAILFLVSFVNGDGNFGVRNSCALTSLGVLLGFSVYIRVDTAVTLTVAGAFLVFSLPKWRKCLKMLVPLSCGALCGIAYCGFDDYLNYGKWFISPRQWIAFQLKYASRIFGRDDFFFYFGKVVFTNHTFYLLVPIAVGITVYYCKYKKALWGQFWKCEEIWGKSVKAEAEVGPPMKLSLRGSQYTPVLDGIFRCTMMTTVLFLFYSCQPHKEVRFVHDALVGLTLCCGGAAYVTFRGIYEKAVEAAAPPMATRRIIKLVLYIELLLFAFDSRLNLPSARDKSNRTWAYAGLWDSGDVNQCLEYISRQTDVTGVFADYSVHMMGGYTVLHRDVPLFAKTHFEFREWCTEMRVKVKTKGVEVATVDDVCDFISVHNAKYALKRLIEQPKYNYVVVPGETQFLKKGFRKVYNSSEAAVYKRASHKGEVEYLEELAKQITATDNNTVLEYEASWLLTLGLPVKAMQRLEIVSESGKGGVKMWQLMAAAMSKLKMFRRAEEAMEKCYELHGREECGQQKKVVLHQEYALDINVNGE